MLFYVLCLKVGINAFLYYTEKKKLCKILLNPSVSIALYKPMNSKSAPKKN